MTVHSMKKTKSAANRRRVTSNAFWNRVGEEKENIIRVQALEALELKNTTPTNRLRKIDDGEYVHLDDKDLRKGFDDLLQGNFFTQEEYDAIFADAQPHEIPESQK